MSQRLSGPHGQSRRAWGHLLKIMATRDSWRGIAPFSEGHNAAMYAPEGRTAVILFSNGPILDRPIPKAFWGIVNSSNVRAINSLDQIPVKQPSQICPLEVGPFK